MFQSHIRLRLQSHACTEDVGQGSALLGQGIDDWRAGRCHGRLQHVAEDGEHAVERLVLIVGLAVALPLDARHHLSNEDQVDDEGRGEERVLADIEDTVYAGQSVHSLLHLQVKECGELTRSSDGHP